MAERGRIEDDGYLPAIKRIRDVLRRQIPQSGKWNRPLWGRIVPTHFLLCMETLFKAIWSIVLLMSLLPNKKNSWCLWQTMRLTHTHTHTQKWWPASGAIRESPIGGGWGGYSFNSSVPFLPFEIVAGRALRTDDIMWQMCSFYFLLLDVIYFHFFKYYLYNELLFGGIGLLERKTISKSTEKMKRVALNMFHRATIDGVLYTTFKKIYTIIIIIIK